MTRALMLMHIRPMVWCPALRRFGAMGNWRPVCLGALVVASLYLMHALERHNASKQSAVIERSILKKTTLLALAQYQHTSQ